MSWFKYVGSVSAGGEPVPNVRVFVYKPGTTTRIPIFQDKGFTPFTQPLLTNPGGYFYFYVNVAEHPEIRLFFEKDGYDFSHANAVADGITLKA